MQSTALVKEDARGSVGRNTRSYYSGKGMCQVWVMHELAHGMHRPSSWDHSTQRLAHRQAPNAHLQLCRSIGSSERVDCTRERQQSGRACRRGRSPALVAGRRDLQQTPIAAMDNLSRLFNIRKTCLELLRDRNYLISQVGREDWAHLRACLVCGFKQTCMLVLCCGIDKILHLSGMIRYNRRDFESGLHCAHKLAVLSLHSDARAHACA